MSGATLSIVAEQYVTTRLSRREITGESARSFRETLRLLSRHLNDPPAGEITEVDLRDWIAAQSSRLSAATLSLRISTVKTFFRWCVIEGWLEVDPSWRIKAPRRPKRVPRWLSDEQVLASFDAAPDPRSEVIVTLMVHCGARAVEVAGIEVGDVDLRDDILVIRKSKGGRQRTVPIGPEAHAVLARFMMSRGRSAGHLVQAYRRKYAHSHDGLSPKYVARLASDTLKAAAVRESGHALRHTFAKDMIDKGGQLRDVQAALGHESITTTEIYTGFADLDRLRPFAGQKRYRRLSATA